MSRLRMTPTVCLTGFLCIGSVLIAAQQPTITCPSPEFDFGKKQSGLHVDATFIIRNDGDAPLEIARVIPGCGCTSAHVTETSVPPKGQTTLVAVLSLLLQKGDLRKQITISSNDPNTPLYNVYITGTATSPIDINPEKVFFGPVDVKDSAERTVILKAPSPEQAFHVIKVESARPDCVTASFDEVEASSEYRVHIKLSSAAVPGELATFVRVHTDNRQFPAFAIPLTATIKGDLAFGPTELRLVQKNKNNNAVVKYIVVSSDHVADFHVLKVDCPDPSFEAEVLPVRPSVYRIRLSGIVPNISMNGKKFTIHTDVPSLREIQIPMNVQPEGHTPITTKPFVATIPPLIH